MIHGAAVGRNSDSVLRRLATSPRIGAIRLTPIAPYRSRPT